MRDIILVINAGSSSIKFAIFAIDQLHCLTCLYRGRVEGIGTKGRFVVLDKEGLSEDSSYRTDRVVVVLDHEDALKTILTWIDRCNTQMYLLAVGHRIVHGGLHLSDPVLIDSNVMAKLEALVPLAPLHQPHNLRAIEALSHIHPGMNQVACFDTAFHQTVPAVAQVFALPKSLSEEGLRCYGFHGLSFEYIADLLPQHMGSHADSRVVIAHLGQGASLCAMKDRKSKATTMTFTPLDGLPMGTRCGSIDPAVVLYLLREKGMSINGVCDLLHYHSGLLGLSGLSADMRELLASENPDANFAIDVFIDRVCRELGSMAASLGGLDALIFTAGIGEHAPRIRERICDDAAWLGIDLDRSANISGGPLISTAHSSVSVWVIPTNEELMIARHTLSLTCAAGQG